MCEKDLVGVAEIVDVRARDVEPAISRTAAAAVREPAALAAVVGQRRLDPAEGSLTFRVQHIAETGFEDVSQPPARLNIKVAAVDIPIVLDHDIIPAFGKQCAVGGREVNVSEKNRIEKADESCRC